MTKIELETIIFTLPEYTPDGELRDDIHEDLFQELLDEAVTLNRFPSEFVLNNPITKEIEHDDVLTYQVSYEEEEDDDVVGQTIINIAAKYADFLGQTVISIRIKDKEHLINIESLLGEE